MGKKNKVLLIGWDAADWKVISPLMDQDKMPALSRMVSNGVMGNLATLHPVLSPMLWTSIATGKRPFKHGIHGFIEPRPDGSGVQPVTNISRKTKAVWNILNQKGYKSNVVGWWPSHPAEPLNGAMVSNHYQRAVGPIEKEWPMPKGTVYPERLHDQMAELRFHPNELVQEHIFPFIPRAGDVDQDKDRRLASLMKILAECTSIHSAGTWLMDNEEWDFMAIYYDAIDHFCHGFMRYHPPRQAFVSEEDFDIYQHVIESGYRYHDLMLNTLLRMVDEDTTVILMSDHGFHPDHLRPRMIPSEPAGPAVEHRDFGIFVMMGPGIKKDELVHGANLLDIAPTILTLYGLPLGEDMDGKPLLSAFEDPPDINTIPSWDEVKGDDGQHAPDTQLDPVESREALRQLEELGYIEKMGENREQQIADAVRELEYNLARAYIDCDLHEHARPLLEKLYRKQPSEYRFGIQLAMCYRALDRIPELHQLVEAMNKRRQADAESARESLKKIAALGRKRRDEIKKRKKEQEKKARKEKKKSGGKAKAEDAPKEPSEMNLFTPNEKQEIRKLRSLARINVFALDYLMGYVLAAEGKLKEALTLLNKACKAEPMRPGLHIQIGETYLKLKQWSKAEGAFQKALSIDQENPHAHLGLCKSYLPRRRNFEAASEALTTVGLFYHYPMAHFCLGVALHRLGKVNRAIDALQVAIDQNPNFAEAHSRLAYIYRHRLKNEKRAREHREMAKTIRKQGRVRRMTALDVPAPSDQVEVMQIPAEVKAPERNSGDLSKYNGQPITLVSGLPRSGTSMVMQMLEAGGMDILTDGVRTSDEDNPKGYLECEAVKNLRADSSWLIGAGGKVVKIIAQLLPFIRPALNYRILYIERDLKEVMASQQTMLKRNDSQGPDLAEEKLIEVFEKQTNRIKSMLKQAEIPVCYLKHRDVVQRPKKAAKAIATFLKDENLDPEKMAGVVDPQLYRQKTAPASKA